MPVYEIISFTPSEAFLTDPSATLKPAIDFFSTVEGGLGLSYGITEEDKTGLIFIVWERYEHHKAVIDTPGYPLITGLRPVFGGDKQVLHVEFQEQPVAAMNSDVTEIAALTLKEGKTKEKLAEVLDTLNPMITAEEGCAKNFAWGYTKEEPEKLSYLILGWTSSKRHFEVVTQDSYKDVVGNLYATADIKMLHTSFKKAF